MTSAWERLPDEPMKWFVRFQAFLALGPTRTIEETWRSEYSGPAKRPDSGWAKASKTWRWKERAEAYDQAQHPAPESLGEALERFLADAVAKLEPRITTDHQGRPLPADRRTTEAWETLRKLLAAVRMAAG